MAELDKSSSYVKFGENRVINDYLTKPIFKLGREFDRSNRCMKFGRNSMKNEYVEVTTDRWTDGQAKNNRANVCGALMKGILRNKEGLMLMTQYNFG